MTLFFAREEAFSDSPSSRTISPTCLNIEITPGNVKRRDHTHHSRPTSDYNQESKSSLERSRTT